MKFWFCVYPLLSIFHFSVSIFVSIGSHDMPYCSMLLGFYQNIQFSYKSYSNNTEWMCVCVTACYLHATHKIHIRTRNRIDFSGWCMTVFCLFVSTKGIKSDIRSIKHTRTHTGRTNKNQKQANKSKICWPLLPVRHMNHSQCHHMPCAYDFLL